MSSLRDEQDPKKNVLRTVLLKIEALMSWIAHGRQKGSVICKT